ncbi:hypothetical protein EB796_020261 [Bugula neritina]|uniref:Fork-head domain-containing protein n=1 Tax=Bugula neritina TaxID=10212 RepID=A0A7J7J5N2_BUGNE|nr:hypothetical protein EB796_020261 [Bugula neritina]
MTSVTEKEPESRSAMDISVNEVESTTPNEKDGDSTSQLTTDEKGNKAYTTQPETDTYSKPSESYVMIIATAIMQSKEQRMSLGSIYNWIERKYPYFTKNDATQGLDEAIMKRSLRSLHIIPPYQGDRCATPPHSVSHFPWQYSTHFYNQTPTEATYYHPYSPAVPTNNIVYNNVGPNVNYHHYYHPPASISQQVSHVTPTVHHMSTSVTCSCSPNTGCLGCPASPTQQLYHVPQRFN